jgi:hypothetical protein
MATPRRTQRVDEESVVNSDVAAARCGRNLRANDEFAWEFGAINQAKQRGAGSPVLHKCHSSGWRAAALGRASRTRFGGRFERCPGWAPAWSPVRQSRTVRRRMKRLSDLIARPQPPVDPVRSAHVGAKAFAQEFSSFPVGLASYRQAALVALLKVRRLLPQLACHLSLARPRVLSH